MIANGQQNNTKPFARLQAKTRLPKQDDCLSFFSFSYLFGYTDWPSTWHGSSSKNLIKHHRGGKILPSCGVARCSQRQFCSEVVSHISEHFRAYFRLKRADDSDLGIIGKIFFSRATWVQMIPILVKGDDVKSETKANARHGRLRLAQESMG